MLSSINAQNIFEGPQIAQYVREARASKNASCIKAFRNGNLRKRARQRLAIRAVSKNDLDEVGIIQPKTS